MLIFLCILSLIITIVIYIIFKMIEVDRKIESIEREMSFHEQSIRKAEDN